MAAYPMAVNSRASASEALHSPACEPYGDTTGEPQARAPRKQKGSPRKVR